MDIVSSRDLALCPQFAVPGSYSQDGKSQDRFFREQLSMSRRITKVVCDDGCHRSEVLIEVLDVLHSFVRVEPTSSNKAHLTPNFSSLLIRLADLRW